MVYELDNRVSQSWAEVNPMSYANGVHERRKCPVRARIDGDTILAKVSEVRAE
jgi:hypothetical protein